MPAKFVAALLLLAAATSAKADLWAKNITIADGVGCIDPMLKFRGQYEMQGEGLELVVSKFKEADVNSDGRICRSEIKATQPDKLEVWAYYDTDGNGCIFPSEAREVIERDMVIYWEADFKMIDTNRDGRLELFELESKFFDPEPGTLGPQEVMDEFDLNFDESITKKEFVERSIQILREVRGRNPHLKDIRTAKMRPARSPQMLNPPPLHQE